jgi:adenylate cyclase
VFRLEVLEKLGDASFADGALAEAIESWGGALALAGEARRRADLERRIGAASWALSGGPRALAAFERSLASLGADVENLEAARLYQELGRVHFRLGRHEEARAWAERALALGERLGAADVVSHAHNTIGVTLARAGDVEAGAAEVARSLDTALGAQLGSVACRAYTNLAVMFSTIDPARSADYCRAGIALCERIGDALQKSWLYCALAGGHCTIAGDYDEGVEAARAAVELDERLGQRSHLPIPLILLAQIHQCRGEGEAGAVYYRRALEVAESVGDPQMLLPCYEGLAMLALERGDEIEADRWLGLGREAQERTGSSGESFVMLPFLC